MAKRIIASNELVTGPPAQEMLHRALANDSRPLTVLDNACGGGILAANLLSLAKSPNSEVKIARIVAADLDENMVDYIQDRIDQSSCNNVDVLQGDQQALMLPDAIFTHVFNNFGIFFCPNDDAALAETFRILQPGGLAGFTTWSSIAWWPSLAVPALTQHIPEAPALPIPDSIFPAKGWEDPAAIWRKLADAGFQDIDVNQYSFTPHVRPVAFAEACAALTKGLAKRFWSDDENSRYAEAIEPAYLTYLYDNFPDGKWDGKMTANISIARRPAD